MNRVRQILRQLEQSQSTNINVNNCQNTKYRYTVDGFADKVFTKEQRDFYEENGYIVIRGLLPRKDIEIVNKRFDDLVCNPSLRIPEMIVMRDVSLTKLKRKNRTDPNEVTKLQQFAYDPVFFKHYLSHPKILPYIKAFCGNDIRSWHHMYINKPKDPGTLSSRHPLHQDLWYFPLNNLDRFVGCWTALQPITRQNGGLCLVPGTHKYGKVFKHDYPSWHGPSNLLYVAVPDNIYKKEARKRIHLKMEPGDCVLFHGLAIHGSSANLSNRTRRSLCCHFLNSKLSGYEPFIRSDQVKYSKGISPRVPYKQFFKLKSRQIMGDAGDWAFTDDEYELAQKYWFKRKLNLDRNDFKRNPDFNKHLK